MAILPQIIKCIIFPLSLKSMNIINKLKTDIISALFGPQAVVQIQDMLHAYDTSNNCELELRIINERSAVGYGNHISKELWKQLYNRIPQLIDLGMITESEYTDDIIINYSPNIPIDSIKYRVIKKTDELRNHLTSNSSTNSLSELLMGGYLTSNSSVNSLSNSSRNLSTSGYLGNPLTSNSSGNLASNSPSTSSPAERKMILSRICTPDNINNVIPIQLSISEELKCNIPNNLKLINVQRRLRQSYLIPGIPWRMDCTVRMVSQDLSSKKLTVSIDKSNMSTLKYYDYLDVEFEYIRKSNNSMAELLKLIEYLFGDNMLFNLVYGVISVQCNKQPYVPKPLSRTIELTTCPESYIFTKINKSEFKPGHRLLALFGIINSDFRLSDINKSYLVNPITSTVKELTGTFRFDWDKCIIIDDNYPEIHKNIRKIMGLHHTFIPPMMLFDVLVDVNEQIYIYDILYMPVRDSLWINSYGLELRTELCNMTYMDRYRLIEQLNLPYKLFTHKHFTNDWSDIYSELSMETDVIYELKLNEDGSVSNTRNNGASSGSSNYANTGANNGASSGAIIPSSVYFMDPEPIVTLEIHREPMTGNYLLYARGTPGDIKSNEYSKSSIVNNSLIMRPYSSHHQIVPFVNPVGKYDYILPKNIVDEVISRLYIDEEDYEEEYEEEEDDEPLNELLVGNNTDEQPADEQLAENFTNNNIISNNTGENLISTSSNDNLVIKNSANERLNDNLIKNSIDDIPDDLKLKLPEQAKQYTMIPNNTLVSVEFNHNNTYRIINVKTQPFSNFIFPQSAPFKPDLYQNILTMKLIAIVGDSINRKIVPICEHQPIYDDINKSMIQYIIERSLTPTTINSMELIVDIYEELSCDPKLLHSITRCKRIFAINKTSCIRTYVERMDDMYNTQIRHITDNILVKNKQVVNDFILNIVTYDRSDINIDEFINLFNRSHGYTHCNVDAVYFQNRTDIIRSVMDIIRFRTVVDEVLSPNGVLVLQYIDGDKDFNDLPDNINLWHGTFDNLPDVPNDYIYNKLYNVLGTFEIANEDVYMSKHIPIIITESGINVYCRCHLVTIGDVSIRVVFPDYVTENDIKYLADELDNPQNLKYYNDQYGYHLVLTSRLLRYFNTRFVVKDQYTPVTEIQSYISSNRTFKDYPFVASALKLTSVIVYGRA